MNLAAIVGFAQIAYDLYQQFRTPTTEVPAIELAAPEEPPRNWREADGRTQEILGLVADRLNQSDAAIGQLAEVVNGLAEAQAEQARQFAAVRQLATWALVLAAVGAMCGGVALAISFNPRP